MAKYDDWISEEGLIKIEGWAKSGLTEDQIAKNIGIVRSTLWDWKTKFESISIALKKGKEVVDFEVENALLKRALGYEYEETKTYIEKDGNGKERKKIEKTVRHMPPDVTAQIYWLKNRKPETWRNNPTALDKKEQESRIAKNEAQTNALQGMGEEIESIKELEEIMGFENE